MGFAWGSIDCPAPTCADDIAILSTNSTEHQTLLSLVSLYAAKERYEINATKSATLIYSKSKEDIDNKFGSFSMAEENIPILQSTTHLGILRECTDSHVRAIESNINTARKTLYALMGAGLHGKNGLNPAISVKIYETYTQSNGQ